ncbi:gamma-type small acid-soluble spore protein [Bacillus sp. JJ664]
MANNNNNQNFTAGKTATGTNIGKVKQQNQQGFGQEFANESATDVQAVRQANQQSAQKAGTQNFGQQNQQ